MKEEKLPSATSISRAPFPASKKVFVKGELHNIKVAMREISLTDSNLPGIGGVTENTKNPPVTVYDTSGPYTDPEQDIDVHRGLARLREQWIFDRQDVELLSDISSGFGKERLLNSDLDFLRFEHTKKPLRAKKGANVSQMYYAKRGIVTPEMEYVAIRENQKHNDKANYGIQHPGNSFGANTPVGQITPDFVRDEIAAGRAIIPNNSQVNR